MRTLWLLVLLVGATFAQDSNAPPVLGTFGSQVKDTLGDAKDFASEKAGEFKNTLNTFGEQVNKAANDGALKVKEKLGKLRDNAEGTLEDVKAEAQSFGDKARNFFGKFGDEAKNLFGKITGKTEEGADAARSKVENAAETVKDNVQETAEKVESRINQIRSRRFVSSLQNFLSGNLGSALEKIKSGDLQQQIQTKVDEVKDKVQTYINEKGVTVPAQGVPDIKIALPSDSDVSDLLSKLKTQVDNLKTNIPAGVQSKLDELKAKIPDIKEKFEDLKNSLPDDAARVQTIKDKFEEFRNKIPELTSQLEKIKGGLSAEAQAKIQDLENKFQESKAILDNYKNNPDELQKSVEAFVQQLKETYGSNVDGLIEKVGGLVSTINFDDMKASLTNRFNELLANQKKLVKKAKKIKNKDKRAKTVEEIQKDAAQQFQSAVENAKQYFSSSEVNSAIEKLKKVAPKFYELVAPKTA